MVRRGPIDVNSHRNTVLVVIISIFYRCIVTKLLTCVIFAIYCKNTF